MRMHQTEPYHTTHAARIRSRKPLVTSLEAWRVYCMIQMRSTVECTFKIKKNHGRCAVHKCVRTQEKSQEKDKKLRETFKTSADQTSAANHSTPLNPALAAVISQRPAPPSSRPAPPPPPNQSKSVYNSSWSISPQPNGKAPAKRESPTLADSGCWSARSFAPKSASRSESSGDGRGEVVPAIRVGCST